MQIAAGIIGRSAIATGQRKQLWNPFQFDSEALLNKGAISHPELATVFLGAVAMVDAKPSSDELQHAIHRHMRSVIEEAAQGFGGCIPPPGQTGIQRTQ